jgi:hypothetical protein
LSVGSLVLCLGSLERVTKAFFLATNKTLDTVDDPSFDIFRVKKASQRQKQKFCVICPSPCHEIVGETSSVSKRVFGRQLMTMMNLSYPNQKKKKEKELILQIGTRSKWERDNFIHTN